MRVGIVQFPGTVGIDDLAFAYETLLGAEVEFFAHTQETIRDVELLVIPGGASFGDGIRPGVLTRLAPIAPAIRRFGRTGNVLGIGNGFQILCELGLLRGTLLLNSTGDFMVRDVYVTAPPSQNFLSKNLTGQRTFQLPLACSHGSYWIDRRTLTELEDNNLVVLRYSNDEGTVEAASNPNGSVSAIAGLSNATGNIVGLMVHPERMLEARGRNDDGLALLRATMSSKIDI